MSDEALNKIKNLMVISCDCLKQGNRDIASNMMELALDEMSNVEPEDLEVGLSVVKTVEYVEEASALENEIFDEDVIPHDVEIISEQAAYDDLRSVVRGMIAKSK